MASTSSSSLKATHQYLARPQRRVPATDTKAITHSVLMDGSEHVVSHGGTGQYNIDGAGTAACGLAALNFARVVFSIEQGGLRDAALLQAVLARECAEVRRLLYPLPNQSLIISSGNNCNMRTVVWQSSSRSRRYLSRTLV